MTQALGDVLANRDYSEPPEIRYIKDFVQRQIGVTPAVTITSDAYIIKTSSAAAAGMLRTKIYQLQKELETKKRLVIRVS